MSGVLICSHTCSVFSLLEEYQDSTGFTGEKSKETELDLLCVAKEMASILQTQLNRTIQESIGNALDGNRSSQHSVEEGTGSRLELDLAELKHQFEVFKTELAGSIAILKDIRVSRHRIESCLDTIVKDLHQFRKEWVDRDNLIDQASMELKINDLIDSIKDFRKEAADKQPTMIQASPACVTTIR